jgi:hypothetical protein
MDTDHCRLFGLYNGSIRYLMLSCPLCDDFYPIDLVGRFRECEIHIALLDLVIDIDIAQIRAEIGPPDGLLFRPSNPFVLNAPTQRAIRWMTLCVA